MSFLYSRTGVIFVESARLVASVSRGFELLKASVRFLPRLILMCLASLALCGCVRRRLTVRTNPPGALVFIDGQEIGRTPVATPFTYYGNRKFRIVMDGYETINVIQPFPAPWYQVPGIDFFAENIVPNEIRDERVVDFELTPKRIVTPSEVLIQADQLRTMVRPNSTGPSAPLP